MTHKIDSPNHFYHQDPAYGLNDWEAVVTFVRALLENSEHVEYCWSRTRLRVMANDTLLSQTFVQHLGRMRDARAVDIICEKLGVIDQTNKTLPSPWCPEEKYLELLCLEALSNVGGNKAKETIENYINNPQKQYLREETKKLEVLKSPRNKLAPLPKDFPDILKGIISHHNVLGEGGDTARNSPSEQKKILDVYHKQKWNGKIETLSGDEKSTTFKLKTKITDHINNFADPFSDFGIFMSKPKIEYPLGNRRWANSHTFLYFPVVDGSMYGYQYTWDTKTNTITTHFHEHVQIEEANVNPDGKTITVANTPISTGIELRGNTFGKRPNSAVRGVWDNPEKKGKNYYTRRANLLTPIKHLYYFNVPHEPIVNQFGVWMVDQCEKPERFFDSDGICTDAQGVIEALLIPLHEPKILAGCPTEYQGEGTKDPYLSKLPKHMQTDLVAVPPSNVLDSVLGVKFDPHKCGHAGVQMNTTNGYKNELDLNCDGVIDEREKELLDQHAGKVYRINIGDYGYFGLKWLSPGIAPRSQTIDEPAIYVCSYDYGAGYDPDSGTINLCQKAKPGQKLYVEYLYDAPAELGSNNIKVYLQPEI